METAVSGWINRLGSMAPRTLYQGERRLPKNRICFGRNRLGARYLQQYIVAKKLALCALKERMGRGQK